MATKMKSHTIAESIYQHAEKLNIMFGQEYERDILKIPVR
jgi:hypothetical protein